MLAIALYLAANACRKCVLDKPIFYHVYELLPGKYRKTPNGTH